MSSKGNSIHEMPMKASLQQSTLTLIELFSLGNNRDHTDLRLSVLLFFLLTVCVLADSAAVFVAVLVN